MANLRSSAKLADLISPEGKTAFLSFLDFARGRLVRDMKALHVLRRADGSFHSLDLGLDGPDLDSLLAQCSAAVLAMDPDSVVPMQPERDWWEFWTAPIIHGYIGYHCPLYRYARCSVTVRGGEWPQ